MSPKGVAVPVPYNKTKKKRYLLLWVVLRSGADLRQLGSHGFRVLDCQVDCLALDHPNHLVSSFVQTLNLDS